MRRGRAAELILRIRTGCLQMRAMHSHTRDRETATDRAAREQCQCCKQAAETAQHFLFECPCTQAARDCFESCMHETVPAKLAQLMALPPGQRAVQLVNPALWGEGGDAAAARRRRRQGRQAGQQQSGGWDAFKRVATYICDAWKARCAALNGRETEGG